MSALTRGLFSKLVSRFSQLHVSSNGVSGCVQSSSLLRTSPVGLTSSWTAIRNLRSSVSSDATKLNAAQETRPRQEVVENPEDVDLAITKDVIAKVNAQIQSSSHGRLFAVIQMAGKQRRVTDGDLIMIEGFYPTNVGDMIRAEKILLVGSRDFTLLGRPLLRPDLVRVEATVIEKSLTHTKTSFKKKRRKNYKRIHFFRHHFTILRINCVRLEGLIDKRPEIEGVDGRVF